MSQAEGKRGTGVVICWTLAVVAIPALALLAVLISASAVFYMIPSEACDSNCWTNDGLTRTVGVLGLPVAAATALVVPAALVLSRRRPRAWIITIAVIVAIAAVWSVTAQHLINAAPAAG